MASPAARHERVEAQDVRRLVITEPGAARVPLQLQRLSVAREIEIVEPVVCEVGNELAGLEILFGQRRISDVYACLAGSAPQANPQLAPAAELTTDGEL